MRLFSLFHRPEAESALRRPDWHRRETALVWGAPMTLFSALAFMPVMLSMILEPFFHHARILGCVLIPVLGVTLTYGISRLAFCLRRAFDVISLFAAGAIVVLIVISMCLGVVLASTVVNF